MVRKERGSFRTRSGEAKTTTYDVTINIDQVALFIIVGFILVAVIAMGVVTYYQNKVVSHGNCSAVGGQMVEMKDEFKCIKTKGIGIDH